MNGICLSIFILFYSFIRTEQLTCLSNCSNTYVKHDGYIRPNNCINMTSEICKAQIIAYYKGKTYPKYFNYTYGFFGDIQKEEEHRKFVKINGLINFTEYQFIINARKSETILIADIYYGEPNDYIFIGIEQLFKRYNQQINPFYNLKSLIYSDKSPNKLICYDSKSESNQECLISNNSVCISNSNGLIKQCSSESDVHIHYKFTISSPDIAASKRTTELIICNKNNCNDESILIQLENIAKFHTYDMISMNNTANGQYLNIFLLIIIYFIVH